MKFQLLGSISDRTVIAAGPGVRVHSLLNKAYGVGRWRKMKGTASVMLANGVRRRVGKRDLKIKRYLDDV
jgi:hypothetical protein